MGSDVKGHSVEYFRYLPNLIPALNWYLYTEFPVCHLFYTVFQDTHR